MFASDEERKAYYKKWRAENKERIKRYNSKWKQGGGDDYIKAYNKRYYENVTKERRKNENSI